MVRKRQQNTDQSSHLKGGKNETISFSLSPRRECSSSVVECSIQATPASLRCDLEQGTLLVQPRKTGPYISERLLMGHKESNQTKQNYLREIIAKLETWVKVQNFQILNFRISNLKTCRVPTKMNNYMCK